MNWKQLLSTKRFGLEEYHDSKKHNRTDFQRDYDRLIFSAPFRRLQNKTQVFPLPGSIFVHNRLTHSIEVSSVGRSLGDLVAKALKEKYKDNQEIDFESISAITSAACLAHDLGNPPFGHSGETAIGNFFKHGEGQILKEAIEKEGGRWDDLINFEGNANSLRLLIHQFKGRRKGGFVMTYSTLASIVKYPFSSEACKDKQKFGFFQSEENSFKTIAEELGILKIADSPLQYARHPLVYLVEAADDICYKVMDIEDAYKLGILSKEETINLFFNFFEKEKTERFQKIMSNVEDDNEHIAFLRSVLIGLLVNECAEAFITHEKDILDGKTVKPLIKLINPKSAEAYKHATQVSINRIYNANEVIDIELAGHRIIGFLLKTYINALLTPHLHYSKLLLSRIPDQYDINGDTLYTKLLAILDFISGMTDIYALDLYRKITGINIPTV